MLSSQEVLNGVRMAQAGDADATTWSDAILLVALNQALKMLTLVRPDVTAKTAVVNVQRGARQAIPDDGLRLIRVICNATNDNQLGRIIRLVVKEDLDSSSHAWMYAQGSRVEEYMFDDRMPKHFYIYPNAPSDAKIAIEYSAAHAKLLLVDENDVFVDAIYDQPIQELMLYKLLSGTDVNEGALHLRMALDLLGVKDSQDERITPARKSEAK